MPIYVNRLAVPVVDQLEKTASVASEPTSATALPSAGIPSNVLQALNAAPLSGLARPVVTAPMSDAKPNVALNASPDLGVRAPESLQQSRDSAMEQIVQNAMSAFGFTPHKDDPVADAAQIGMAAFGLHPAGPMDVISQVESAASGTVSGGSSQATTLPDVIADLNTECGDAAQNIGDTVVSAYAALPDEAKDMVDVAEDVVTSAVDDAKGLVDDIGDLF